MAINTKGKRKIVIDDEVFYWLVRIEKNGNHRIHIMSEDKKFNEVYPMLDTEVAVTPSDIREIIVKSKREASS